MKDISIVVPVWNEEGNILPLLKRIHNSFTNSGLTYEVVFVDDNSSDKTVTIIKRHSKSYPIRLATKEGKKGKAYSLHEGIQLADSGVIAILDADLQYPPEAIVEMGKKILNEKVDIIVANRIVEKEHSKFRHFLSTSFRNIFGKHLFGLTQDVQSGLKVFKKNVYMRLDYRPTSGWTFDLELLHKATQAGFIVESFDINFVKRANGKSKVSFLTTSLEIGLNALKVRLKPVKPLQIRSDNANTMRGAGIGYKKQQYITHSTLHHSSSALNTITTPQRLTVGTVLFVALVALILRPLPTAQAIIGILSAIYFLDTVFNFFLVMKSLHNPQEIVATEEEIRKLDTRMLPTYSILCPLYKEAHVIPQFLQAIDKLDYPKSKLDVLLLLEEDDKDSIEKVEAMQLPEYVRMIVVPHSMPKTKPKACNYGLSFAKGEYLVIYDAEDMPDPLQLKKAYIGFQKVGEKVLCLQAKLNYYNPHQNLLTRFFTAEYSLWFDVTLTGLQAAGTSIPLGGTSNHFRTKDLENLEGWDPFNVTEDADLGIRLFKRGYKTAIIDSVTLEEANSNVYNWIRQRSRWIKGYMQTYLVHTRNNFGLTHNNFWHSLLFHLNIGGKIAFILINPFLWLATISYFVLYRFVGPTIESLYPSWIFYMAGTSLVFGNFMFVYYYMIGCAKREQWSLIKYVYLIPFYWLLISWSGFVAFYQLIFKPHYWEKTIHGLHLQKAEENTVADTINDIEEVKYGFLFPKKLRLKLQAAFSEKNVVGLLFIGANIVGSALNFIFSAYLGRSISLEDFATISLISGLFSVCSLLFGSVGMTINYKAAFLIGEKGETAANEFWRAVRKKSILFSLIISLLWIVFIPFISYFFRLYSISPIVLFTPVLLVGFAAALDKGLFYATFSFSILSLLSILEPFIKLIGAIFLVWAGLHYWTFSVIPISVVTSFFIGWFVVTRIAGEKKEVVEKQSFPFKFLFLSLLSGISSLLFLNVDVVLAKHYLSPLHAGEYSLVALIAKMVFFTGSLAYPFIMPLVSRNEGAKEQSNSILRFTILGALALSLPMFVIIGIFGSWSVPLLFGAKALPIVPFVLPLSFAMVCFSIAQVLSQYYLAKKYYSFSFVAFLLGVLQIGLLTIFHNTTQSFVYVMSFIWISYLISLFVMHVFAKEISVFESNLIDFLGLFHTFERGEKKDFKNLRILVFNWRDTKHKWAGGAEVYIHELAKRWIKEGNQVTIFCGNDGHHLRNETIDGIQIIRRGGFYTVYVWAFLYYIFQFRGKYDVIIDSENGIPFFTPLYSGAKSFLLIHHVHQEVFRKSLKPPFSNLALFLEAKVMPIVYRNTQVITVSPSSKEEILRHKLTIKDPIVIYNGVDLESFKPGIKSKNPMVLYVGRLQYYKSLHIFIKAAKKILEKIPTAEFIIAGEGEEKWSLIEFAKKVGMEGKINFTGKVSHEDKISLMQKAWVFVNPSFMEGWGITTIEANACGTPAVASNVPGLRDSIKNPHTGYLATYGNADEFAEKILKLINDKKTRKEFSDESIKWASNFSWEKSAQIFLYTIASAKVETQIKTYQLINN